MIVFTWIIRRAIVPLLLGCVFLLTYVGGVYTAYAEMIIALPLLIWILARRDPWRSEIAGHMALAAFLILATIFVITNPPGRADYLFALNFYLFLLLGPLIVALAKFASPGNTIIVARLALAGTVVALALALVQVYGLGMQFSEGYGANRINTAGAIAMLGYIATLGFFAEKSARRFFYLLGPILATIIVFYNDSRGPIVVLLVLFAVLMLAMVRRKWLALLVGAAVAVTVVAALLLFPSVFGRLSRLPTIVLGVFTGAESLGDNSANIRFRLYLASWRAFIESPFIGYGWGERGAATWPFYGDGPFLRDRNKWHLHSDIFNFAVAGGIAGLSAYVLLLAAPVVGAWRSVRDSQYGVRLLGSIMLTAGYVAYGSFNLAFGFEYLTTFYAMMAAILIGFCRDAPIGQERIVSSSVSPSST